MGTLKVPVKAGDVFGNWTVTRPPFRGETASGYTYWFAAVRCTCGHDETVYVNNLKRGLSKGCRLCRNRDFADNRAKIIRAVVQARETEQGLGRQKWRLIVALKAGPCTDCGSRFPVVCMELDHVPERGVKLFEVNQATAETKRTLEEIAAEAAKCDLVCANCHNWRTHLRIQEKAIRIMDQHDTQPEFYYQKLRSGMYDVCTLVEDKLRWKAEVCKNGKNDDSTWDIRRAYDERLVKTYADLACLEAALRRLFLLVLQGFGSEEVVRVGYFRHFSEVGRTQVQVVQNLKEFRVGRHPLRFASNKHPESRAKLRVLSLQEIDLGLAEQFIHYSSVCASGWSRSSGTSLAA